MPAAADRLSLNFWIFETNGATTITSFTTDIIRFSDGTISPAELADTEFRSFLDRTVDGNGQLWGDRLYDVAAKCAPEVRPRVMRT